MAEDKKPKDKKVEEKKVEDKQTLQQQLDAITFKNAQAQKVIAIQKGEQKVKDNLGRNKARYISSTQGSGNAGRRVSAAGNIAGLKTLGNSFGK